MTSDNNNRPDNVELLSAQAPITDFKGLITAIIAAVVSYGIFHILPYETDVNKGIAVLILTSSASEAEGARRKISINQKNAPLHQKNDL